MADSSHEFVDLYAVLDVDPSASADQINAAIASNLRKWRGRQNHPDGSKRAEAEAQMRMTAQAEKTLLDQSRRLKFDAERQNQLELELSNVRSDTHAISSNTSDDWVEKSIIALEQGALGAALQAAENAVDADPTDPNAWAQKGKVLERTTRFDEAPKAFKEAVALDPSVDNHLIYARSLMNQRSFPGIGREDAYEALRIAYEKAPERVDLNIALVQFFGRFDAFEDAFGHAKWLGAHHPNDRDVQSVLTDFFIKAAKQCLTLEKRVDARDVYRITSASQLERVRECVAGIRALPITDKELLTKLSELETLESRASERALPPIPRPKLDSLTNLMFFVAIYGGILWFAGWVIMSSLQFVAREIGRWAADALTIGLLASLPFIIRWIRVPRYHRDRRDCKETGVIRWGI